MSQRVLILANDFAFDRLQRHGRLPALLLQDCSSEVSSLAMSPETGAHARIRRLRPGQLFPPEDAKLEEREQTDYLLALLTESVLCHIAVIGDDADAGQMSLEALSEWYERFERLVTARIAEHRRHYQHVLIVVFAARPAPGAAEALGRLLSGNDPAVDAVYLMREDLELGEREYFHARHVWPIAVGGLLLRLTASKLGDDERGQMLAWRILAVGPGFSGLPAEQAFDDLRRAVLVALHKRLAEPPKDEVHPPISVAGIEIGNPELQATPLGPPGHWQEFQATTKTESAVSPDRWAIQFKQQGSALAHQRSQRAMGAMQSLRNVVADRWTRAHNSPANLYEELRRTNETRPELSRHRDQVAADDKDLRRKDETCRALASQLRADAVELDNARAYFLDFGVRLFCGLLAAAAFAWGAHLLHFYFGLTRAWIYVSIAALMGAILPPIALWIFERYRGERAVDDMIERFDTIDTIVRERFTAAWDLLDAASQLSIDLRSWAAWRRMQQLLTRAAAILDSAIQPMPGLATANPAAPVGGDTSPRDANEAHELDRFGQHSRQLVQFPPEVIRRPESFADVVNAEAHRFIREFWTPICHEHDPSARGLLPVRVLLPRLADFLFEFNLAIEAALSRRLFPGNDAERLKPAAEMIHQFTQSPLWWGMSCNVPGRAVDRIRQLILADPDLSERFASALPAHLAQRLQAADTLRGRLSFALHYEETVLNRTEAFGPSAEAT